MIAGNHPSAKIYKICVTSVTRYLSGSVDFMRR